MSDHITLTGIVGTEPRVFTTAAGIAITSFRLATSQRVYDSSNRTWRDRGSNWFTVSCFRALADHVAQSVHKGERVIVSGRLRISHWTNDGRDGTAVDIEADAVGHDLLWGTSQFTRSAHSAPETPEPLADDLPGWPTVSPGSAA